MKAKINLDPSYLSAFGTLETGELTPVLQGDFVYGLNSQVWTYSYVFTITTPTVAPTYGTLYSNNNGTYMCVYTSGTTMVCVGNSAPLATGTLTKISGTGDATITFSAFTNPIGITNGTGASVDTNSGRLRIQGGTGGTGTYAYLTSKKIIRYRAGEGTVARFTPLFTAGVANSLQFWGIGSIISNAPYDGYFFGYNGTTFGIAHYNAGVQVAWIPQASWNGIKANGESGMKFTWDPTKGSPVMIKYPYLGYGDILFFVQSPETGDWLLVHTIQYANRANTTQLSNPSLQFIGFTSSSGSTTNLTMYCGSVGVFISGVRNFISNPKWAADNFKTAITTETNILTLKNCINYNGIVNRGKIRLNSLSVASNNNSNNSVGIIRLKINSTIGGTPAFSAINGSTADGGNSITSGNSIASVDVVGTTVAGGQYIFNISITASGNDLIDLSEYEIVVLPGEILTVSGTANVASILSASLNWSEDV